MRKHVFNFLIMFVVQLVLYGLLTINFRAVAQANIIVSVVSDTLVAAMGFFVIKKIASSDSSSVIFMGYVMGSAVGSVVGILLSKWMLGQ